MGIPSYFSNIIKNHENIVRKVEIPNDKIHLYDHLFLDSNSIIYDSFYAIIDHPGRDQDIETIIISSVIMKIKEYILLIRPRKTLFIALDGICPLSKMDQQKTRRYKSSYLSFPNATKNHTHSWSTTNITPGTNFMNKLTQKLHSTFIATEVEYHVEKVIISSSDIVGEGEQKNFQHIRDLGITCINDKAIVYGLDADLLMLSFLHIQRMKNIYVFREAPDFIKSYIPITIEHNNPNALFLLDIQMLSKSIITEMRCGIFTEYGDMELHTQAIVGTFTECDDKRLLDDYVFLCFFLGNDFLPHNPSLNIRTHGIQVLLNTYRKYIGKYDKRLVDVQNGKIIWKSVYILIDNLAIMEHDLLLQEYKLRNKQEKRFFPETNVKEMEHAFNSIPLIYRSEEKYICPEEQYWEKRYYKTLFSKVITNRKELCDNYLEGLEWVFRYYTQKCPDWRWKYKENYPPLFTDLNKYVPRKDYNFIKPNTNKPLSSIEQLIYVLPRSQLKLLPKKTQQIIERDYMHYYPDKNEARIIFAFCKYFWESHVELPKMTIVTLQDIRRLST